MPVYEISFQYASLKSRLPAFLIDLATTTGIAWLIWRDQVVSSSDSGFHVNMNNEQLLIPAIYFFLFWAIFSSSIGKFLLGVKIIDKKGNKITYWQALLRTAAYFLLAIGGWLMLLNTEKMALHDLIAGTRVVSRN